MTSLIPQPKGLPLLGNIFDVDPNNTWWSLKTLAEKYGEVFQITVLGKTIVFVAGAALAEEVCDERRFRKYVGGPIVEIRYAVHDSLFAAYDHEESWGVAHRIMAPVLSPTSVASMFDDMGDLTSELMGKWKGLGDKNIVCPVDELNRLTLEATMYTLCGEKLDCLLGPEHVWIQAMEESTSEAMKRPTRPRLLNWLLYDAKLKRSTAVMRSCAADILEHGKNKPGHGRDLLSALINATDPETGKSLTDSQIIDEIVSMPIGASTAPALLATAILFVCQNPEVVVRARREMDAIVGNGPMTHSHLGQLEYIQGVLRESLRLSCAAPGFNVEPIPSQDKSPVLLGGGTYQIAHDQPIIIVLAGVNKDPTVFEDPLAFKPERMMGESFDRLPMGVKRWFGNGKRECIGRHWAYQFSLLVLARLLNEVDFEMTDPSYRFHQDGWFNLRPVDFNARVRVREA